MLKAYFTDGLVQIAIVLSLLRTDLNTYLNNNYLNYPEVQEIILGPTASYAGTNFHHVLNEPEMRRKNIDAYESFSSASVFRDLRSFRPMREIRNDIQTFLLVSSSNNLNHIHNQDQVEQNDDDIDNVNTMVTLSTEQQLLEDLETEGQNLINTLEESIGAMAPLIQSLHSIDPTHEDLDLIEVLWRQDIDLGVGKEVFDNNLRQELEREQETELQKERQKQKDNELLQQKLEEQRRHAEQRWRHENFTQDGETGEWIPLGAQPAPPIPDFSNVTQSGEQYLSAYDGIDMMRDELLQGQNNNYSVLPPPPQYQQPQSMHITNTQSMYNTSACHYNQQMNNGNLAYHTQSLPLSCNINQGYLAPQQPQYNSNYNRQQHIYNQVQNLQQSQPMMQTARYPNQSNLEATWQDLVHILDLPMPQNQTQTMIHGQEMLNVSLPNQNILRMQDSSSMCIQNMSAPNQGMVSSCHRSPPHSSGLLSPCAESFNSSMPNGNGMGSLDWDSCGDFTFANITASLNQSENIDDVDKLLPDLITEDELEDINFSEMGLSDAVTPASATGFGEDTSSDSAVSMGSQSAGSPDQNDLNKSAPSPFDVLEGAIGGHDRSSVPKSSKYDPDDYRFSNSCSYSSGGDSNCSNFSSSSNDTPGGSSYSQGSFNGGYSPANNGHINHNHTYPQKSGSDPKDIKKHMFLNKEGKHKGPQSKDKKRIEELKIPFTIDYIVNSPVEEFNEILTRNKFTDQQLQLIRDIRRRGKNKVAAHNCRKRKIGVIEHLEDEMTTLERMRDKMLHERHLLDKQTREMKDKLGELYSDIFHSLRDDHGQPYDPARFSLQQSSDGDVFLVPKNYLLEDDKKQKQDQK